MGEEAECVSRVCERKSQTNRERERERRESESEVPWKYNGDLQLDI